MKNYKNTAQYKSARSPSGIVNRQNLDAAGAQKTVKGTSGIYEVLADSSIENAVAPESTLRVANTTANTHYVWTGIIGDAPATVDATNSIAIPAGHVEHIYLPAVKEGSMAVKSSNSSVQILIIC